MSTNILTITASAQNEQALSRQLSLQLANGLCERPEYQSVIDRDLNNSELPLLDNDWVSANFTPEEERSEEQKQILKLSDDYVAELHQSKAIIIGTPIYNFSVPAALKAYIDLICRARLTFKYTENGPVGLLENKKAYVVITSGGVPLNSPVDFATPYIKQVLHFVGISDITFIDAAQMNADKDGSKLKQARTSLDKLIAA